uniref:Uncharacterized protein n=1 Tax=Palpitomonas bilix TaxID=652834 RepID=A0A7S3DBZ5_9EUKA|mmetsp:Transcript_30423/g.78721  ORF Transcript_30423/g.78721 Transcript_30423/m.78721 type:complete len:859 (+) Transcript_30423:235-2811(+)
MAGASALLPGWLSKAKEDITHAPEWNSLATQIFKKLQLVLQQHSVEFFNDLTGEEKSLFVAQAEAELHESDVYKDFTTIVGKVVDSHLEEEIREEVRSADASLSVSDLMIGKAGLAAASLIHFAREQKWRLLHIFLQKLPPPLRVEVWKMVLVDVKTRVTYEDFVLNKQGTAPISRAELEITKKCRHILETEFMELNTGRILAIMKSVISFYVYSHSDGGQAMPVVPEHDPLGHCFYAIIPLLWVFVKSDGKADASIVAECLDMMLSVPRPIDVGEALAEQMPAAAVKKNAAKASAIDFGRAVLRLLRSVDEELYSGLRRVFVDNVLGDDVGEAHEGGKEGEDSNKEDIPSVYALRISHTLQFATSRLFVGAIRDMDAVFYLWDQIILANSDPATLTVRKVPLDHDDVKFGQVDILPHICCTLLILARERLLGAANQTSVDNSFRNALRHYSSHIVRRTFETKFGNTVRERLGLSATSDVRMDVLQHKFKPGVNLPDRRYRRPTESQAVQVGEIPKSPSPIPTPVALTPVPATPEIIPLSVHINHARALTDAATYLQAVSRRVMAQLNHSVDVDEAWGLMRKKEEKDRRNAEKQKVAQKRLTASVSNANTTTTCPLPGIMVGDLTVKLDSGREFVFVTPKLFYRDETVPGFVRKVMAMEENRGAIETYLDAAILDLDLPTRKKKRREKRIAATKVGNALRDQLVKLMPFMSTEGAIFGGAHSSEYADSDEEVEQVAPSAPDKYMDYAAKRWSYISRGRVLGPSSFEEFLEYARQKKVTAVWYPGMEKWVKLKEMEGLQECIDFDPSNVVKRAHWLKEVDLAESVPSTPPPAPDGMCSALTFDGAICDLMLSRCADYRG